MNLPRAIQQEYQGFQITDDSTAEWAVRKIKEAMSDTAKWQAHFSAQLAGIQKSNDSVSHRFYEGFAGWLFRQRSPQRQQDPRASTSFPAQRFVRKTATASTGSCR